MREQRFTSIDRDISRNRVDGTEHGMFKIVLPSDTRLWPNLRQQSQAARLLVLGNMGLAQKTGPDSWQVRKDFEAVLRAMQRVNDHQRTIAAHGALLSDERLPFVRLDLRTMKSVEGRVLVHGEEESGADKRTVHEIIVRSCQLIAQSRNQNGKPVNQGTEVPQDDATRYTGIESMEDQGDPWPVH